MSKEEVIEDLAEIVEETAELVGESHAWRCGLSRKQHMLQLMLVGAVAGGACAVGGYFLAKKQMQTKYDDILKQEIASAKAFYSNVQKKSFHSPQDVVNALNPEAEGEALEAATTALTQYQGVDKQVIKERNVFETHPRDDFDLEEEVKSRTPDRPYIISEEEFLQGEMDFNQSTLTYYVGDGTLADEQDQEIPYLDPIVGENNMERFGHGSNDERTLYIRNERLSNDYEIVLNDGKYSHEVLGLQHSDQPSIGRMRSRKRRSRGGDE